MMLAGALHRFTTAGGRTCETTGAGSRAPSCAARVCAGPGRLDRRWFIPAGISPSPGRGIGWFPLAPHEVYVPGYRHTPRHILRINLSNTIIADKTQITSAYTARDRHRAYRHRGQANAVTVVQDDRFIGGRPIGDQRLRVSNGELSEFRDSPRPPAIAPNRESMLAGELRRDGPIGRSYRVGERPNERPDVRSTGSRSNAAPQLRREQAAPWPIAEHEPRNAHATADVMRQAAPRTYSSPATYAPARSSPQQRSPVAEQSDGRAARDSPPAAQDSQPQSRYGSRPNYQKP